MYIPLTTLRKHVYESNKIEGIKMRGGPYVQSHLAAALFVAQKGNDCVLAHSYEIHRRLGIGTDLATHAGKPRMCRVWVGGHDCPSPEHVPMLMEWWSELVQQYISDDFTKKEAARVSDLLHDILLSIHPFQDGNGRTARLILNALRLHHGLPWLVVEARNRVRYYQRIATIEREVFKKEFPHVYD
jgi:fido (protein-threonine AMPylation protein)